MTKRIIAFILIIIIGFGGCAHAIPDKISPFDFQSTPTLNLPGLKEVIFAEDIINTFIGLDWQIFDAFYLKVEYRYAMVSFTYNNQFDNSNWISIVMNPEKIYYMTPIILNNTMIFDFTNIPPAEYKIYLIHNIINGND